MLAGSLFGPSTSRWRPVTRSSPRTIACVMYRIKLAIGEPLASHVHETGRVEVTVSGPEGPGASRWVAGGVNLSLQATAGSPAVEVVEIEPK